MTDLKLSMTLLGAVLSLVNAAPAHAQEETPASAFTLSGGATLVSDYRFRGISQTDKRFALQGTITVAHSSGLYASLWGSSIDDYVAAGADQELDLIAGYKKTLGSTTFDIGVLYYYYPGSHGADTDFVEPYVAVTQAFGAITAKASAAYAPKQRALTIGNGREDNLYLAGDVGAAIPQTPISVSAHFGHSFGPSYLTIGDGYTDWSIGASATLKGITFGVSYVDTNKNAFSPSGRNISKAGIVGSVGVSF
ncbi:TorF family putative porin [Sphingomonas rhizophila]|nr:TorF family putative porin [Sphingomonas rhizophila]